MVDPYSMWHDSQLLLPLIGNRQAPHLIAAVEAETDAAFYGI